MSLEMLERALPALTALNPERRRPGRPSGTDPAAPAQPPAPAPSPAAPAPAKAGLPAPGPSGQARYGLEAGQVFDPGGLAATARIDWALIADALGTPLPRDYMALVDRYQGLVIDDWLGVRMPRPGWERSYVDTVGEGLLELEDAWMTGDSGGHVPYPRPGGLIPWGGSIDGDAFYWRTHPEGPEAWTVVVCDSRNEWREVSRDLTDYLAGLVLGEVELGEWLPRDLPGAAPSVSVDGWGRPPGAG